jgi:DNA-directed RNA polymerase specialized sigma24 family protein
MIPSDFGAVERARFIAFASQILNSRDDAEDAVHTAVFLALRAPLKLEGEEFTRWFYTVVRNAALAQLRRRRRFCRYTAECVLCYPTLDSEIYQRELRAHIAALPNGQRECLLLMAELSGAKQIDMAAALRLNTSVFKERLKRARRNLRARLRQGKLNGKTDRRSAERGAYPEIERSSGEQGGGMGKTYAGLHEADRGRRAAGPPDR